MPASLPPRAVCICLFHEFSEGANYTELLNKGTLPLARLSRVLCVCLAGLYVIISLSCALCIFAYPLQSHEHI